MLGTWLKLLLVWPDMAAFAAAKPVADGGGETLGLCAEAAWAPDWIRASYHQGFHETGIVTARF